MALQLPPQWHPCAKHPRQQTPEEILDQLANLTPNPPVPAASKSATTPTSPKGYVWACN